MVASVLPFQEKSGLCNSTLVARFCQKPQEVYMAKKGFSLGILAMVLVFGLTLASCASTNKGGTPGLFNQFSAGKVLTEGQTEVASYTTILGLFSSGLAEYEAAVKDENVNVVTTAYLGFFSKTVAYK
jgi:hypothetical protein